MWPMTEITSISKFGSRCRENWRHFTHETLSLGCYGNIGVNQTDYFRNFFQCVGNV